MLTRDEHVRFSDDRAVASTTLNGVPGEGRRDGGSSCVDAAAGSAGSGVLSEKGTRVNQVGDASPSTTPAPADPYDYAREAAPPLDLRDVPPEPRSLDELWEEYKITKKLPYHNSQEWRMLADDMGLGE